MVVEWVDAETAMLYHFITLLNEEARASIWCYAQQIKML